jgi:hypothetical protein
VGQDIHRAGTVSVPIGIFRRVRQRFIGGEHNITELVLVKMQMVCDPRAELCPGVRRAVRVSGDSRSTEPCLGAVNIGLGLNPRITRW